ncbi:MAG: mechanosensitive ion channel family protein [Flavobacteriales bacterium]
MESASFRYGDLLSPSTLPGVLFCGVACFAVAFAITLSIRRITRHMKRHLTDVTALGFISAFVQALTWLFAFIAFAHVVPELRALGTALLAGVSVVSLAVGIAAQNTLGNLVAGFSLVLSRTLHVGEHVRLGSSVGVITGTVKLISLSTTMLVDDAGMEVNVPNSVVMGSTVTRIAGPTAHVG